MNDKKYENVQNELEMELTDILKKNNDEFLNGLVYIKKWNYVIDETETIPYVKINYQGLPIE